eukprot:903592-Rhodomonas_salina.3
MQVTIPLPPTVNSAIKQNLEDDSGVVIQGAGGGYAPITVQVTMPGQQPPNPNQFVNKPMTPGPTGRSARLTESQLERRGYTSDQIKRTLQKQREALAAEEKNLKAGFPRLCSSLPFLFLADVDARRPHVTMMPRRH